MNLKSKNLASGVIKFYITRRVHWISESGAMPEKVFGPYLKYAEFHNYSDWITRKKGGQTWVAEIKGAIMEQEEVLNLLRLHTE